MRNSIIIFLMLFANVLYAQQNLTELVNPFIGSLNDANTYPGAVTPWNYSHPYWENWKNVQWYKK